MKTLLALSAFLLSSCGALQIQSTSSRISGEPWVTPVLTGTITGTTTLTHWLCGGAHLPEDNGQPMICSVDKPSSVNFAVARPLDKDGFELELVTLVTSAADGSFTVEVTPGIYTLTLERFTKDAVQPGVISPLGYLIPTYVAPFEVKAGEIVVQDINFMTPPPPAAGIGR